MFWQELEKTEGQVPERLSNSIVTKVLVITMFVVWEAELRGTVAKLAKGCSNLRSKHLGEKLHSNIWLFPRIWIHSFSNCISNTCRHARPGWGLE